MPPRQRREDTVIVALLGGSVAQELQPFLQRALNRWFAAKAGPRQSAAVLRLAVQSGRQPQQTIIVANALLLGGEFDLIVNLDGFNEIVTGAGQNHLDGVFPAFPKRWRWRVALTDAETLLAGQIAALRREQAQRMAAAETSPLRWSALFGLSNRWQRERTAAAIIQRNHQLAAAKSTYSLEKHGPRSWLAAKEERLQAAARFWYRGSLALAQLAELAGAEYYHFLQPNQYVPNAKPLSPKERELAYKPQEIYLSMVEPGYPLLRELGRDLQSQGVNYFDLTGIFLDRPETLYIDACCHLNDRGYALLAAAMAQRLGPALLRRGGTVPAAPDPALAAGRPEDFRVSLQDGGKQLRYVREDCAAWDTFPHFFLHLIPRDLADLPPGSRRLGLDNRDFRFGDVGGRLGSDKCTAQIPLPDYPIAALRTGQYVPELGDLWSVELIVPIDTDQLRAEYTALAAAEPVAQDYFDLYDWDNRLIYLRESCAAADTAAAFFLHIIPENPDDLPADKRPAGFDHAGFDFARQGGHFDGKCLASVALPEYPIKEMRTGQHIPGQDDPLWSARLIAAPDYDQLRGDYAALAAANSVERAAFDLYLMDNRLIYLRENCAAADTAAGFFLHIIPADAADLPADRREAGFVHSGFEFARNGGHFDGKCLASVALPDYPIKEMRTGQFVPGQGDLWSVQLTAAP